MADNYIAELDSGAPRIDDEASVAPTAVVVGRGVTVGQRVVLHGARVDDDVPVGMGSVVVNGAHIGSGSIVAAGAVVTRGKQCPPGSVIAGVPATPRDDRAAARGLRRPAAPGPARRPPRPR
ncbi:LbetaH domain-containing protein [Geodermatophilus marinus]|uniref:hypothetical protein n=1 Tax=Geodermatophilus sp. LHW52908 TaxID=2303986 RepID=UPI001F45AE43|nr:hypothetical protein [Geodermatophilus sp. LHW52908]